MSNSSFCHLVAVYCEIVGANWELVSSHSRKPTPSTSTRLVSGRDTAGRFWPFYQSCTAVPKCHLNANKILLTFLLDPFARACMRGRISIHLVVLVLLCVICTCKERTGKELLSWSWVIGCTWCVEPRGHFKFCFVLFSFIFSSKPCARWTRNKEKTRSSLSGDFGFWPRCVMDAENGSAVSSEFQVERKFANTNFLWASCRSGTSRSHTKHNNSRRTCIEQPMYLSWRTRPGTISLLFPSSLLWNFLSSASSLHFFRQDLQKYLGFPRWR